MRIQDQIFNDITEAVTTGDMLFSNRRKLADEIYDKYVPKWVDVNDRLPETIYDSWCGRMLVTDGLKVEEWFAIRHNGVFTWNVHRARYMGIVKENITHWMPLPKPPSK